jgi:hypothetical protein
VAGCNEAAEERYEQFERITSLHKENSPRRIRT